MVIQLINKFCTCYGTEGSLLSSQQPATGLCPKPEESSPHPPTLFQIH
jgi:hypothetical protein